MNQPLCVLMVAIATVAVPIVSLAQAESQPNVVVMLADDLGWGAVSYHSDWTETPNVDRLAGEGIELDRFYVAPMCTPTRAGLMTGRYPIRFGLARAVIPPQRNFGLSVQERTIADALGEAGYKHRGIFGKWHLGHHDVKWHPLSRGFTHFEGHYNGAIDYFKLERDGERDWHINHTPSAKQGYATDLIAEAASDFIRESAVDAAPYFCYVPFNAPHSPFQAKPEDIARYAKNSKTDDEATLKAMIWSMDQGVGQVLRAIEDSGEADNTQVWFLSDNGGVGQFKANNRPLHGSKLTTFEGGVRVVACVRWPAKWQGGRKLDNTIGYIDVLPTVLASAGVDSNFGRDANSKLDGSNLCGLLEGTVTDFPERDWYSYHGQSGAERETIAIKTAQWKLVVIGPDVAQSEITDKHEIHLYRMPDDLLERENLADQHPDVVKDLFAKLQAYRSLQPENAVPTFGIGKKGFKPWKDWDIRSRTSSDK
ncbi:sulfatase-like hydrolase/transferase [Rubripirellula reticaptiva]|uniref:Arylsulfatase n=1 Tax=Rubripirellula reticaptiva TaxID=2528013 RepID=A0A5C6ESR2_9BACT|nr:sulfatase-like hydrolase/transferase [Rubripirellula reticaptiva]TWU51394.1 Arylsulfatase precursor [Rubripirellula reticaptiva]